MQNIILNKAYITQCHDNRNNNKLWDIILKFQNVINYAIFIYQLTQIFSTY